MLYKNFGFSIESDIELPFIMKNNANEKVDIRISQMSNRPDVTGLVQEYSVDITNSERLVCTVIEHSESLIMDFADHVCFKYVKQNIIV